jgi:hypothetical protein
MSILDRLLPASDASRVEQRVITAPLAIVYQAAISTDFLDAPRENRFVRILFRLRSSGEHVISVLRKRPFIEPPEPPSLRLEDIPVHGDWVRLGEDPPTEMAFGVIGRFWGGETRWLVSDGSEFASFNETGYAKIGCHLLLERLDDRRTRITYEARTFATDPASRRAFLRYWRVASPFVGFIMRATLSLIDRNAVTAARGRAVAEAVNARLTTA